MRSSVRGTVQCKCSTILPVAFCIACPWPVPPPSLLRCVCLSFLHEAHLSLYTLLALWIVCMSADLRTASRHPVSGRHSVLRRSDSRVFWLGLQMQGYDRMTLKTLPTMGTLCMVSLTLYFSFPVVFLVFYRFSHTVWFINNACFMLTPRFRVLNGGT